MSVLLAEDGEQRVHRLCGKLPDQHHVLHNLLGDGGEGVSLNIEEDGAWGQDRGGEGRGGEGRGRGGDGRG